MEYNRNQGALDSEANDLSDTSKVYAPGLGFTTLGRVKAILLEHREPDAPANEILQAAVQRLDYRHARAAADAARH